MNVDGKLEAARTASVAVVATIWGISLNDVYLMVNIAAGLTLTFYTLLQAVVILPKAWATLAGWYQGIANWIAARKAG